MAEIYAKNKNILQYIHDSKISFCSSEDGEYTDYDKVMTDMSSLKPEEVSIYHEYIKKPSNEKAHNVEYSAFRETVDNTKLQADKDILLKENRKLIMRHRKITFLNNTTIIESEKDFVKKCKKLFKDSEKEEVVIRLMTKQFLPEDFSGRLRFPPFQHYAYNKDGIREVLRSQWEGEFENGNFTQENGNITDELARVMMIIVKRFSNKGSWRYYTYLEDMKSKALIKLCEVGLQFDESKNQNPFAYYTTCISNEFKANLNIEKKHRGIRDNLLEKAGLKGSYSSQNRDEDTGKQFYKSFQAPKSLTLDITNED